MNKTSILIVEDEGIVAANLSDKLIQLGHGVSGIAAGAEEAIEKALTLRPQLILMDIQLNGLNDGIWAAEAIQMQYDVPIIYLTAHSDPATLARAKVTGPLGYVLKPFEMRDLATQIEMALYRHQAEQQLREQRELLRVTLTSIGDAVIATDSDGLISFMNPVAEALTGWPMPEAAGKPFQEIVRIVNKYSRAIVDDPVSEVLRTGLVVGLANHTLLLQRDGGEVPIDDSGAPILDSKGNILGEVLVFRDISERRQAEEMIQRNRQILQLFIEYAPAAIAMFDTEMKFISASRRFLIDYDIGDQNIIGRSHYDVFPAMPERWKEIHWRCLLGAVERCEQDPFPRSDGKLDWIRWEIRPWFENTGETGGIILFSEVITEHVRDVDNLNKNEEELRNLNRTLRALSNVLNAIIHAEHESGLLHEVCRIIIEDCDYAMVWIGLAEEDADKSVRPVAQSGFDDDYLEAINITWADTERGSGPTGAAIRTGMVNICKNMTTDPKMYPWREQAVKRGYASSIALPLKTNDRSFGAVTIYARQPDAFSENEAKLLVELADALAYGIMAIRFRLTGHQAQDALQESESRNRLLSETAGRLLTTDNPQGLVNELCRQVMKHLDCQVFFNFLVNEKAGDLQLSDWAGIPEEEARKIQFLQYGVAVCGCVAQECHRIVAENIEITPDPRIELVKSYGIQAYACHPLLVEERLIGTLSFGTKTRTHFSPEELSLMKTVAGQVATAMERIRLIGELKESRDELEKRVEVRTAELSANERKYRKLSQEFHTLLNAISDTLVLLSPEMEILWTNGGNPNLSNISPSEAVGQKCHKLLCGNTAPCEDCPARRCIETSKKTFVVETRNGIVLDKKAFPVIEGGTVSGVILVISDITEKMTMQAEAMQADHLASLGELAAGVAHEINNPITGIINYGQILLNECDSESIEKDIGERIVKEGARISRIVKNLLTYTRDRRKEKRPTRVCDILEESIILAQVQLRKEGIDLKIDLPDDLPEIKVNFHQIQQGFINVINNARYALNERYPESHSNKRLEISGERVAVGDRLYVRIIFHDHGTGISVDDLPQVTKLLFSTKPFGKGTGLGLNITQRFITNHGGRLSLESAKGEFTKVIIDLPAHRESKEIDENENSCN